MKRIKSFKYSHLLIGILLLLANYSVKSQRRLILVAGQSNCSGHGDSSQSPKLNKGNAFQYNFENDTIVPLQDPVGENVLMFDKATSGSAWPAFANAFCQKSTDTLILVPASRGGSALTLKAKMERYDSWDSTSKLFNNALLKTKAAEKKDKLKVSAIVWIQGERDASAITAKELTAEEYEQNLIALIMRFRRELRENVPFFISVTGFPTTDKKAGFFIVQNIQRKVAKEISHVYIAADMAPSFIEENKMTDFIHYNQNGLNELGTALGSYVRKTLKQ